MYKTKERKQKLRKNKVWELNHLLVSSLPTPVNLAIYRLRGQVLPQSRKGLPITVGISCVFLFHHGGDPIWEPNLPPRNLLFQLCVYQTISLLPNHLFTTSCCCLKCSLALDLDSSAFKILCILICKTLLFDPLDS